MGLRRRRLRESGRWHDSGRQAPLAEISSGDVAAGRKAATGLAKYATPTTRGMAAPIIGSRRRHRARPVRARRPRLRRPVRRRQFVGMLGEELAKGLFGVQAHFRGDQTHQGTAVDAFGDDVQPSLFERRHDARRHLGHVSHLPERQTSRLACLSEALGHTKRMLT